MGGVLKSCRARIGAVLVASTALTMILIAPGTKASASSPPHVTLSANSSNKPVTGYVFVDFEQKGYNQAKLQGVVTGAPAGSAVELFSSTFPFKAPSLRVASAKLVLSAGKAMYSFTESPQFATRYLVEVVSAGSNPKVLARSAPSVVYVSAGSHFEARTLPAAAPCATRRCP